MDTVLEHLRGLSGYNKKGEEIPDPKPGALQIDLEAEMPLEMKVMRALRSELWTKEMEQKGLETFEEANDFDVPEEESEFKTIHEDESGDVMAFEEGVRRGFIEEIPEEKRKEVEKTARALRELQQNARTNRQSGGTQSTVPASEGDQK